MHGVVVQVHCVVGHAVVGHCVVGYAMVDERSNLIWLIWANQITGTLSFGLLFSFFLTQTCMHNEERFIRNSLLKFCCAIVLSELPVFSRAENNRISHAQPHEREPCTGSPHICLESGYFIARVLCSVVAILNFYKGMLVRGLELK